MNDIFYKYTDFIGAQKILGERTLKFSHYSALNDPFDAYYHDMFGLDPDEDRNANREALHTALEENNPELFANKTGIPLTRSQELCDLYSTLAPEIKRKFSDYVRFVEDNDPKFVQIHLTRVLHTALVRNEFETAGIFCATRDPNNLLMWAHYADKHQGVVVGLKPKVDQDPHKTSSLVNIQPVIYRESFPNFIDANDNHTDKSSAEFAIEALYRVFYSKSTEWSYEQELRLAIPRIIPHGKKEYLMNLHPTNEVVEVYLGCRLLEDNEKRQPIIELAKSLNPAVTIYQAKPAKRSYKLEHERIS